MYDVLVIGGGINGVGIARDAAGRGLSVLLCEQHDLASHTSSASTKLIHGGLRYLAHFEFSLVHKALQEREILLRNAPHIMWPLRFVIPCGLSGVPSWIMRCGLYLYDHLARRDILPSSQSLNLSTHVTGQVLKDNIKKGFVYSDVWVDDARLVVLNAIDAKARGATILTRTTCTNLQRVDDVWHASLYNDAQGDLNVVARTVVNAAGPWGSNIANICGSKKNTRHLRLVKGSHIVVPRLFDHAYAYLFQNPDGRIIFALPYEHDFTLIGTTDLEYSGDAGKVEITESEINYLCTMSSRYFKKDVCASDVVWTYSGVRPLLDDHANNASAVTRDYLLECDDTGAPILHVWGGKLTTYRRLAHDALKILSPYLYVGAKDWTLNAPLPGGDISALPQTLAHDNFSDFMHDVMSKYPWLPPALAERYAHSYGTRITLVLNNATCIENLGQQLAPGLYEAEARYLCEHEWATSAEDILWRRTKRGLHCTLEDVARLRTWLGE